eukprot:819264-Rhodomonas_salina.1
MITGNSVVLTGDATSTNITTSHASQHATPGTPSSTGTRVSRVQRCDFCTRAIPPSTVYNCTRLNFESVASQICEHWWY